MSDGMTQNQATLIGQGVSLHTPNTLPDAVKSPSWNINGTFAGWVTSAAPAGAGTQLQYRLSATAFGGVAGTSWNGSVLTLPTTKVDTLIIGTDAINLSTLLHVAGDSSNSVFEQASDDADPFDLIFRKARGTVSGPTVITTGDQLGAINFSGYSGAAGYVTGAQIRAVSEGTIATTRVPSRLVFATGTDAAPTVLTDVVTVSVLGGSISNVSINGPINNAYGMLRIQPTSGDDSASLSFWSRPSGANGAAQNWKLMTNASVYGDFHLSRSTGPSGTPSLGVMYWDAAGLVGINKTSSIGAQLHVVQSTTTTIGGLFEGITSHSVSLLVAKAGATPGANGHFLELQNSSGTWLTAINNSGRIVINGGGDNNWFVSTINGVVPHLLNLGLTYAQNQTAGTDGGYDAFIFRGGDAVGSKSRIRFVGDNRVAIAGIAAIVQGSDPNSKGDLVFETAVVNGVLTERMRITSAGILQFGTHTGLAAETVTGYITIKDSGGTDRKLAVVS